MAKDYSSSNRKKRLMSRMGMKLIQNRSIMSL